MDAHIASCRGVLEDLYAGRQKNGVEMSGRRNQEPIERIGEGRARNVACIDGNDRRHLRDAHPYGVQRIANPLLEGTREANAARRMERRQLEERDRRNTDGVPRLGPKE